LARRLSGSRAQVTAALAAVTAVASHGVVACRAAVSAAAHRAARAARRRAPIQPASGAIVSAAPAAIEHQESDGLVVSVLLAIAVIGYGGFIAASWRQPAGSPLATAVASSHPAVAAATTLAEPIPVPTREQVAERRGRSGLSPRTLTAIWRQQDTRSLQRAFSNLRTETLALHRCGMRVTADDRAVARCEASGATWTIDFRRAGGRWAITDVKTR
jgi:hypothetical protein